MLNGEQFGRYKICQRLGAGGMGEVYLARDPKLDRSVALKVLSGEFTQDELRINRFKQEARAASALNHPNIITIYEIDETPEGWFLATEYIDGETLRDRMKRSSQLTIIQAVKIAEQVADALTAAHQANLVHRDVKPENIMIRRDGYVKVLDFGLAKLTPKIDSDIIESEIVHTSPGLVMGSARYMSPEQARGFTVDGRTDVWSLGVVLYEMIAGRPPFEGETTSDTIAAVIYQEPLPLANFVVRVPYELQRIVRRALRKDRDERYQSIRDFALDLKNLRYELEHEISFENETQLLPTFSDNGTGPVRIHQTSGSNRASRSTITSGSGSLPVLGQLNKQYKWQTVMASFVVIIMLAAICFGIYRWSSAERQLLSAAFEKTQVMRLDSDGKVRLPAISPDGKYVAYVSGEPGSQSLVVRQVATNSIVTVVQPTALNFRSISFSPDGNYIFYTQLSKNFTLGTLYQVPSLGGNSKKLVDDVDSTVTFSPDGKRLAFMRHSTKEGGDTIFTANSDGSNVEPLISTKQTEFNFFTGPTWSPDGSKILVGTGKNHGGNTINVTIAEISIDEKILKPFSNNKWYAVESLCWLKNGSGFLLAGKESDSSSMQIWRVSYPDGVKHQITNDFNNYFGVGLSSDGNTLATLKADTSSTIWKFAVATKEQTQITPENRGLEGEAGIIQAPSGDLIYTRLNGKELSIWKMGEDGSNPQQLFSETGINYSPTLTPDGRFIVFASKRAGISRIWRMDADGKNHVQLTDDQENSGDFNPQVTADGKSIVFQRLKVEGGVTSLFKISIDGGVPIPILPHDQIAKYSPRLSPDGKYLAFVSFDVVTLEKKLRVVPFENGITGQGEKVFEYNLINNFSWSPDSQSLTCIRSDGVPNLWKLPIDGSNPQQLTDFKTGRIFNFAWSRDGKKLYIVRGIINNDLVLIRNTGSTSNS